MDKYEELLDEIDALKAANERAAAEIARLKAGMREYACTGTDHPCGCYEQFLSERAEVERLRAEVNKWLRAAEQYGA